MKYCFEGNNGNAIKYKLIIDGHLDDSKINKVLELLSDKWNVKTKITLLEFIKKNNIKNFKIYEEPIIFSDVVKIGQNITKRNLARQQNEYDFYYQILLVVKNTEDNVERNLIIRKMNKNVLLDVYEKFYVDSEKEEKSITLIKRLVKKNGGLLEKDRIYKNGLNITNSGNPTKEQIINISKFSSDSSLTKSFKI